MAVFLLAFSYPLAMIVEISLVLIIPFFLGIIAIVGSLSHSVRM